MARLAERTLTRSLPPVLRWQEPGQPLPVKPVRLPVDARRRTLGLEAPPWLKTGCVDRSFDFCGHVRRLCADVVRALPRIEPHRRLASALRRHAGAQRANARLAGAGDAAALSQRPVGAPPRRRRLPGAALRGRWKRHALSGDVLSAALPRPGLRRQVHHAVSRTVPHQPGLRGRPAAAGRALHHPFHSKRDYDAHMAVLARDYLHGGADKSLHAFLRMDFAQLVHRHGSVEGVVVPRPRLLPLPEPDGEE